MENKRRADEEEPEEGAAWLATYSDMVTLLMTFFVLMFAISNVDAQKFALLAAGLSRDGITAQQFLELQEMYDFQGVDVPDLNDPDLPAPDDEHSAKPTPAADEGEGLGYEELGNLYSMIINYIHVNNLHDSINAVYNGELLMLTLTNDIWFVSGSADVTPAMRENAVILAQLLSDNHNNNAPFNVIVAGHTDNRPINTGRFPSNWDLSAARALNFLKILIEDSGIEARYFSVSGRGEEEPIGDNDTDEGRQLNRRVEVMISQTKTQG